MQKTKNQNNYAFIDSQNLNLAIRGQGWILDFRRFRKYLEDKYSVRKAFLFIGYVAGNEASAGILSTLTGWRKNWAKKERE